MARVRIQQCRNFISLMLLVALLLPASLRLLPSPASAEQQALYRDLQIALCSEQGVPIRGEQHPCKHCVLASCQQLPQVSQHNEPLEAVSLIAETSKVSFVFAHLNRAELSAVVLPDPGRGPPV